MLAVIQKRRMLLAGVLAVAVVSVLFFTGAIPRPGHAESKPTAKTEKQARPITVTIDKVTQRPVARRVSMVGSLHGLEEVAITPKVEGRIAKIHRDVGSCVKPGDVLLEIDDTDLKLAVAEMEKAVDLELTRLGLKELPPKGFDVRTLPSVERMAALEKNAQARLERLTRVGSAASAEERDQVRTEHRVAQANHQQMILDCEATLAGVHHRLAALEIARQRLRDARVVVPEVKLKPIASGTTPEVEFFVCERMASEGELLRVSPTTTMTCFRLVFDRILELRATVPERYLDQIKLGQTADLQVEAFPGETFHGVVSRIHPTVDRANRTFKVHIEIPNSDRRLHAGCFAKAFVSTRVDKSAVTVPQEALVTFAGVTKVFIVRDGLAREVQVVPSTRLPSDKDDRVWIEVQGDLKAGDEVVTSGQSNLFEGRPVKIRGDS